MDAASLPPSSGSEASKEVLWRSLRLPEHLRTAPAHASIPAVVSDRSSVPNDGFEVFEPIGEGGMGVVYRARQRDLDREVVIKQPKPGGSALAVARLCREAEIAGGLQHPHIPPVHALQFDDEGRPSVVMRRIRGVTYRHVIDHPEAAPNEIEDRDRLHVETLCAVCRALELAHARGIIHRDVKPDNIMLGRFGEVFLLDWGLAAHFGGAAPQDSAVVGTPAYMAPEMLERRPVGPWTDIYLVGATLYHALTRRPLHPGGSFIEVLQHVLDPSPLVFPVGTPVLLMEICRRAVEPDPEARFASIEAMRQALQDALQHQASLSLLETAAARVAWIEDDGRSETHRRRAFDEARFAAQEAERLWPQNPQLPDVVRDAQLAMVRLELAEGQTEAADRILQSLDDAPPELVADVESMRAHQRRDAQRTASLSRLAETLDPRIGARGRMLGFAAMMLATTMLNAVVFAARVNVQHRQMMWMQVGLLVVGGFILIPVLVGAKHSQTSKRLIGMFSVLMAFLPVFTAVGWRLAIPIVELLILESLALVPGYLLGAITLDRRLSVGGVVALAGVVFSLAVPAHAPLGVMVAHVGAMVATAVALWGLPVGALTADEITPH